jgi:hypothetical protein
MAVALLPTEIIQTILSHSTPETFHSARQVSQSWRYAAFSPIILQRQLQCMPVRISKEEAKKSTPEELNALFDRTAHANLFGMRHHVEKAVEDRVLPDKKGGSATVTAISGDRKKLAMLAGGCVDVYEVQDGDLQLKSHRELVPLWTSVSRAASDGVSSWISMAPPYATYQIAMSERGDLMAVALGRTIQMYDLRPGHDDATPTEHVLNTCRKERPASSFGWSDIKGVIENVEFVENDTLLRVAMGREGVTTTLTRVLYLGNPPPQWGNEVGACATSDPLSYWKENVHNVLLDSVELAQMFGGEYKISFRGLRLLPRNHTRHSKGPAGRFFATAVQSSMKNHYCLGFVSEQNEVQIVAQMPDRSDRASEEWKERLGAPSPRKVLSSRSTDASNLAQSTPRWDLTNIPELKTTQPIVVISEDERLWVMYEPGAGQTFSFASGGAIYVCRLPSSATSVTGKVAEDDSIDQAAVNKVTPQPWPFLLDTLSVNVCGLRFEKESGVPQSTADRYVLCAETECSTFRWCMS